MANIKQVWENKANIIKGATNHFLKIKAIEDLAAARLNVCDSCPNKSTNCAAMISTCCDLCGCSLAWKTRVPEEACPAGNWPSINTEE